ncbi:MAG: prepilin-type N-terminal cleavage/methylation domain-containing protein, partial [Liquorilactobacillus satsumensis]
MKKVKKAKVKVYQAFTLVEMSIVLFIIGVLILIILPN